MRNKSQQTISKKLIGTACLISLLILCCSSFSYANQTNDMVSCRPELSQSRRVELANGLRKITGWNNLAFDVQGALQLEESTPLSGSQSARELLMAAVTGKHAILLEDASNHQDVVFCRVIEGRWKTKTINDPPVFIVQIDFADFSRVMGDREALDAFNAGWGVLHEMAHVVNDSRDTDKAGEAGDCEGLVNRMRRECGLAERAEYHFTFLPGTASSSFMTRLVRIAFEQQDHDTGKKKRYWLIWDASLVGGMEEQKQLLVRR